MCIRDRAEEYHNILVEAVAENDEELMEKYLDCLLYTSRCV